ncbi:Hypothetical protein R9X50_00389200 [Acrodontium crateriforme]|uniref:Uncharacterized protein n=1 Tax=Acrodontium crateriforme TaxID=150365 RepID=A0AAQ3M514_9PEZI|nr:Hypothetical protein R9X50_00389200 [Acrodontium crateriforme]
MVAAGQTVTIVNKSGKIVSTSKHLVNVFKEARSAYDERKAEIKASRKAEFDEKELRVRKQMEALKVADDDATSVASSRRSSRRGSADERRSRTKSVHSNSRHDHSPSKRNISDGSHAGEEHRRGSHRPSPLRQSSFGDEDIHAGELVRRHTYDIERRDRRHPTLPPRSASVDDIDMDLAYGDIPPPLPNRKYDTEIELRMKMSALQKTMDEFNCVQHSVTAMIENLQKNPDALAAVALTLGEISSLASKVAPGALLSMKGAFPAIIAILCSPEFAIAAGVGVGVTIIALGGYKIIKKIKAKQETRMLENGIEEPTPETPPDEMEELRELDHIERWRRGIAEAEAESLDTSVDGEFITPAASKTLIEEGRLKESDFKVPSEAGDDKKQRKKKKGAKSEVSTKTSKTSKTTKTSKTSKTSKTAEKMPREPSGLRMFFRPHA